MTSTAALPPPVVASSDRKREGASACSCSRGAAAAAAADGAAAVGAWLTDTAGREARKLSRGADGGRSSRCIGPFKSPAPLPAMAHTHAPTVEPVRSGWGACSASSGELLLSCMPSCSPTLTVRSAAACPRSTRRMLPGATSKCCCQGVPAAAATLAAGVAPPAVTDASGLLPSPGPASHFCRGPAVAAAAAPARLTGWERRTRAANIRTGRDATLGGLEQSEWTRKGRSAVWKSADGSQQAAIGRPVEPCPACCEASVAATLGSFKQRCPDLEPAPIALLSEAAQRARPGVRTVHVALGVQCAAGAIVLVIRGFTTSGNPKPRWRPPRPTQWPVPLRPSRLTAPCRSGSSPSSS
jgi:hypothetical protein